jgi:hypothetical protein
MQFDQIQNWYKMLITSVSLAMLCMPWNNTEIQFLSFYILKSSNFSLGLDKKTLLNLCLATGMQFLTSIWHMVTFYFGAPIYSDDNLSLHDFTVNQFNSYQEPFSQVCNYSLICSMTKLSFHGRNPIIIHFRRYHYGNLYSDVF